MKFDCVLEGGGTKIPALVGAYAAITSRDFELSHAAGTSAGAIIASLATAGYTGHEMRQILFNTNFMHFLDGPQTGWVRKGWKLVTQLGPYDGNAFHAFMKELLDKKGVKEFGDLLTSDVTEQDDLKYRWKLRVIASDISGGRLVTFPHDATLYGIEPDKLSVADAVRASMSIPFFFKPAKFGENYFVDGGLLSNFPIWSFDSLSEPPWPTFGLLLQEDGSNEPKEINSLYSYAFAIFDTALKAHDRRWVRPDDMTHRTISIPVGDAKSTEFDMSLLKKDRLYKNGVNAASNFLDSWSWEDYKIWAVGARRTAAIQR